MKNIFYACFAVLGFIFLVTTLTYTIIYTMVPRKLIFKQDTNYNKIATTADKRDTMRIPFMSVWLYRVLRYQRVARKKLARWMLL